MNRQACLGLPILFLVVVRLAELVVKLVQSFYIDGWEKTGFEYNILGYGVGQ